MKDKTAYEAPELDLILVRYETSFMASGDDVPNPGGTVEPGGWD